MEANQKKKRKDPPVTDPEVNDLASRIAAAMVEGLQAANDDPEGTLDRDAAREDEFIKRVEQYARPSDQV